MVANKIATKGRMCKLLSDIYYYILYYYTYYYYYHKEFDGLTISSKPVAYIIITAVNSSIGKLAILSHAHIDDKNYEEERSSFIKQMLKSFIHNVNHFEVKSNILRNIMFFILLNRIHI